MKKKNKLMKNLKRLGHKVGEVVAYEYFKRGNISRKPDEVRFIKIK